MIRAREDDINYVPQVHTPHTSEGIFLWWPPRDSLRNTHRCDHYSAYDKKQRRMDVIIVLTPRIHINDYLYARLHNTTFHSAVVDFGI